MSESAHSSIEQAVARGGFSFPDGFAAQIADALAEGHSAAAAPGFIYERQLERSERRRGGVFYTPQAIVEYTVAETLMPLLVGRTAKQVLQLRIADLACGGGIFLVVALEQLARYCRAADPLGVEALGGEVQLRGELAANVVLGVDIDSRAAEVARLAVALWIGSDDGADIARSVVVEGDALLDSVPGPIDAVIGNPPWGQKDFHLDDEIRRALRSRFKCAAGPLDPFKLFIERAHELVREGGRWGLVVPDILLLKNHEVTRRLILEGSEIASITHLGQAFQGVNLDAVVVVAERCRLPSSEHVVTIRDALPDRSRPDRSQRQAVFAELPAAKFNLYLDGPSLELYQALRVGPRLGELFEIHEGVHSGNARAQLFVGSRPAGPSAKLILGRGELEPFKLDWHGLWIDLDPGAIDRDRGFYANLGQPHWHTSPKLVVRRTGDRIVAARDPLGFYVSNNMFVVIPRSPDVSAGLRAYLGLLQSSLYTWYFRTEQPRVGRLFAELKIVHLRGFPAPDPSRWVRASGQLDDIVASLERTGAEPRAQAELDEVVFSLFDLDDSARQLVRDVVAASRPR